jgi:hypothetical protein
MYAAKRGQNQRIGIRDSVADPHPHDFGLLDPHSKCGFQMRMRIRDKLRKNSANDKKIKIF